MNPNNNEYKDTLMDIRRLIEQADLKQALHELSDLLESTTKGNEVSFYTARFSDLDKKISKGLLDNDQATAQKNKFVNSLLAFLDEIEKLDFGNIPRISRTQVFLQKLWKQKRIRRAIPVLGILILAAIGYNSPVYWDSLQGRIINSANGQPVPGVEVSLKSNPGKTFASDQEGLFEIPVPFYKKDSIVYIDLRTYDPSSRMVEAEIPYRNQIFNLEIQL